MSQTDPKEKINKFLHDLSNKLVPIKLKLELVQEQHRLDDLKFIEDRIDDLNVFIKTFQMESTEAALSYLAQVSKPTNSQSHAIIESDSIKILLIDDNRDILFTMSNILKRKGYNVSTCDNGLTAFGIINNYKNQFDIIITDELMPGMSGTELIEKCIQVNPNLKFICWSGYFGKEHEDTQTIKFLQKPISKDKLLNKLQELMAEDE